MSGELTADELDELLDEHERDVTVGSLRELLRRCADARRARLTSTRAPARSAAEAHFIEAGHALTFGCCRPTA